MELAFKIKVVFIILKMNKLKIGVLLTALFIGTKGAKTFAKITGSWTRDEAKAACIAAGYENLAYADSADDVTALSDTSF